MKAVESVTVYAERLEDLRRENKSLAEDTQTQRDEIFRLKRANRSLVEELATTIRLKESLAEEVQRLKTLSAGSFDRSELYLEQVNHENTKRELDALEAIVREEKNKATDEAISKCALVSANIIETLCREVREEALEEAALFLDGVVERIGSEDDHGPRRPEVRKCASAVRRLKTLDPPKEID